MTRRPLLILPALVAFLVGAVPALAWTWPVDGPVLQPFGLGGDPYAAGQHRGVDIGAIAGDPVTAPVSGVVAFAGTVPKGGRTVTIHTADGYAVTLVHLGAVVVTRGATVSEGQIVASVGPSGEAEHSSPYVHLGVRIASDPHGYLDPLAFLPPRGSGASSEAAEPAQPQATDAERQDGAVESVAPLSPPAQADEPTEQASPEVSAGEPGSVAPPPPPAEVTLAIGPAAIPVASAPGAELSGAGSTEPFAQPAVLEPSTQPAAAEVPPSPSAGGDPPPAPLASLERTRPEPAAQRERVRPAAGPDAPNGSRPSSARTARRAAGRLSDVVGPEAMGPSAPIQEGDSEFATSGGDRGSVLADPVTIALLIGLGVSALALRRRAGGSPELPVADPSPSAGPIRQCLPAATPCRSSPRRHGPVRRPDRRNPDRIIASDDLLRHDADLLRQLDTAHRSRVLDDRGGHRRAPPPPAR